MPVTLPPLSYSHIKPSDPAHNPAAERDKSLFRVITRKNRRYKNHKDSISLLLPYYLIYHFAELFRIFGFQVFWADNREDTEKIIMEKEPDLAIEWRPGDDDFPIRDLLRKHGRRTPVILALNWHRDSLPDDPKEVGCAAYIDIPFRCQQVMSLFHKVLPVSKKHSLVKLPMVKKGLLFRIK